MPKADYAVFEALNPFFEIIQKGLSGLVEARRSNFTPATHLLCTALRTVAS